MKLRRSTPTLLSTGARATRRPCRLGEIAGVALVLCASAVLAPAPAQAGTSFYNTRIYAQAVSSSGRETVWSFKLDVKGNVVSRQRVEAASEPSLMSPTLKAVFAGHVLLDGVIRDEDPTAPTIWILNGAGHLRPVTTGAGEGFSPAGSTILITREVERLDPVYEVVRQVFLRNLASGNEPSCSRPGRTVAGPTPSRCPPTIASSGCTTSASTRMRPRCSPSQPGAHLAARTASSRVAETQLLPGGATVLSVCDNVYAKPQVHRFVVSQDLERQDPRQVTQNPKLLVLRVGGLLDKTHVLAEVRTSTGHSVLGRLDLKTFKVQVVQATPQDWRPGHEFN